MSEQRQCNGKQDAWFYADRNDSHRCDGFAGAGAPCRVGQPCRDDRVCVPVAPLDSRGTCQPRLSDGDWCPYSETCASGNCDVRTNRCAPAVTCAP